MADRSVVYRLRADIGGFKAQMAQASASVKKAADEMTGATKEGRKFRKGLTTLGNTAGKIGLVAGAGLAYAVKKTADFDKAMSGVQAATHETTKNMQSLRDAAIQAGAKTKYSASEAADGIEQLAKAGVSTKDILSGGLNGALALAAAGNQSVGDAAESAASAMTQFKLSGQAVPHIADLMAAAAGKAQGEVSDLAQGMSQVGLVASQTGLSLEETTGALAAFASSGLVGSDAGTSFKQMLLSLVPNSKQAAKAMKEVGFSAFNSKGEFVGLQETAKRLRAAFDGMSSADRLRNFKTIFGQDAIRAANVLYAQGGTGIGSWIKKVDDSGYAADTAAKKMDNLAGDLEQFRGSLETALIGTGENAQGPLRSLVQSLTDVTNSYIGLGDGAKKAVVITLGATAAIGGGLFVFTKIVTGIASARAAMVELGIASEATAKKTALIKGAALGLSVAAIALGHMGDEATTSGKAMEALGNAAGGALIGFSIGGPVGAAVGALDGLIAASGDAAHATAEGRQANEDYASSFDRITAAATRESKAVAARNLGKTNAVEAGHLLGVSEPTLVNATLGHAKAIKKVNDALAVGAILLARGTIPHVKSGADAYNALSQSMFGTAKTSEGATTGLVTDFRHQQAEAKRTAATVKETKAAYEALPKNVSTLIRTQGVPRSRAEAIDLAKKYDLTKGERRTYLRALGFDEAVRKAKAAHTAIERLDGKIATVAIHAIETGGNSAVSAINKTFGFAGGGYTGDGGKYQPAGVVHRGEFVFDAAATKRAGVQNLYDLQSHLRGYASGGLVLDPPAVSQTVHIEGSGAFTVTLADVARARYIARLSHQSATERRQQRIDELHALQQIRDLEHSLSERNKKTHKLTLNGLDRATARAELAQAKSDYAALTKNAQGAADAIAQVRDAQAQVKADQAQAKADQVSALSGQGDLLGFSPTSSLASVARLTADIATYGNLLGRLKAAGASPALLQQIVNRANTGDFRGAIRLSRALLDNPATLTGLNSALGAYQSTVNQAASLVADPRFMNSAAWAGATKAAPSTQVLQVQVSTDPSQLVSEVVRQVVHTIRPMMMQGVA